jgi:hypothetical protein
MWRASSTSSLRKRKEECAKNFHRAKAIAASLSGLSDLIRDQRGSAALVVALAELARELRVNPMQLAKPFFNLGFLALQHLDLLQALSPG